MSELKINNPKLVEMLDIVENCKTYKLKETVDKINQKFEIANDPFRVTESTVYAYLFGVSQTCISLLKSQIRIDNN